MSFQGQPRPFLGDFQATLCVSNDNEDVLKKNPDSEFTSLLSRGKLTHPTAELFDLTCVLFSYYKNSNKECIQHILIAFQQIYECCFLEFNSEQRVLRRLINCFSKAFSSQQSDGIRAEKSHVKRRRLHYE